MKRYRRPTCDTGRNAPSRMSPDDVRRYCLPCSEKSGKLVAMVCPSRERAKAKAQKARTERARRDREREIRRRFYLDDGTDVRVLARMVKRVKTWEREGPRAKEAIRNLSLEVDDANRYLPWEVFAVHLMRKGAILALTAIRRPRDQANVDSLLTDAACRLWGLDFNTVRRVALNVQRLNRAAALDYGDAIVKCVRAIKHPPPTP